MKKITLLLFIFSSAFLFSQKSELRNQISEITKNKQATVAVSIKGIDFPFELNNENANKKLPMLSVFKFHIGLAVLDFVDQGKLKLDQKFLIKKEDLLPKTHSPFRDKFPEGNVEATLDELIFHSVSWSDNNTTDILLKIIGGTDTVQKFMNEKKVKNFQIKYNEKQMHQGKEFLYPNYTTTKSLSQLYKDFYNGKIVSEKSTEYLYQILLKTETGINKLKQNLPKGIVAHKTGSSGKVDNLTIAENDSGIVTLPNGKRYAISVFVIDSKESYDTNCKMISDISKITFDYLSKK